MSVQLELPPGFRFHPTDEELVNHYLIKKCASQLISAPIIAEIDLYKYDPWNLPEMALYGEKEWYFFSPRDRKYPNGSRPNRAAGTGYWKATGADKPIGRPKPLGIKKALVFYVGKAPKGVKTNWIMHEYRLANVDRSAGKKNTTRLDDWVLCRLYNKKGSLENSSAEPNTMKFQEFEDQKPEIMTLPQQQQQQQQQRRAPMDTSDSGSGPRLQTDSSSSDQVVSPDFKWEKEVQSEPKWKDLGTGFEDLGFNYLDGFSDMQFPEEQLLPLQDMLMFIQKPF